MTIDCDSIYDDYFPSSGLGNSDLASFGRYDVENPPILEASPQVDFSIEEPTDWLEVAGQVALVVLKINFYYWGIYELVRLAVREAGMDRVYPAHTYSSEHVLLQRTIIAHNLRHPSERFPSDLVVRDLVLKRDGVLYSGIMIGKLSTLQNHKWVQFAPGNSFLMEDAILTGVHAVCLEAGFNLFMINGPQVGLSKGTVTPQEMGKVQELGTRFLETAVKAKNIVIAGHSLGWMMQAENIRKHEFKPEVEYLAMSFNSFSNLEDTIRKIGGENAYWIARWLDCNVDAVASSRRLDELGIPEVFFEGTEDELMEGIHHSRAVQAGPYNPALKIFIVVQDGGHHDIPGNEVIRLIREWDMGLPLAAKPTPTHEEESA